MVNITSPGRKAAKTIRKTVVRARKATKKRRARAKKVVRGNLRRNIARGL